MVAEVPLHLRINALSQLVCSLETIGSDAVAQDHEIGVECSLDSAVGSGMN